MQGARVWLREQDQLQPCTVGSCADGNVLFTSDYGTVSGGLHEAVAYTKLQDGVHDLAYLC